MDGLTIAAAVASAALVGAAGWAWASRRTAAYRERAARLEAEIEAERRGAAERVAAYERTEARLRDTFQALSAEALRQNNTTFLEIARASLGELQKRGTDDLESRRKAIGDLLSPVQEALKQVDAKLLSIEKERVGAYQALRQQVEGLASLQDRLRGETANLVQALRAPSVRGRWGEIHLRRLVELAGMLDRCDFTEQPTIETEDGRLRPDLVVHLPGGKRVLVDAKVPLKAYLEAQELPDEAQAKAKLDEHARAVRDHIARLGSKAYWEQFDATPDFVVLFIPGEAFFAAAFQRDPGLIEYGFERRVIPASPTTLISLLKTVYFGWQQERVAESAREIRDLGAHLHERLRVMTEHLSDLGSNLGRAVQAYDNAVGSFERRVLVAARRLKDLGVASRDLPEVEPVGREPRGLQEREGAAVVLDPPEH